MKTSSFKSTFKIVMGVAAAIMVLAPLASQAGDLNALPQVRVSFADLNLDTAAGVNTLYTRVARAADVVCPADSQELSRHVAYKSCASKAIGDAVRNASIPALSQLYTDKTGISVGPRLADNL